MKPNKHLGSEYVPLVFDKKQIYYSTSLNELVLVSDVDKEFNRAKLEHGTEVYISNWLTDLVYIGDI